jgi:hypothetical protein
MVNYAIFKRLKNVNKGIRCSTVIPDSPPDGIKTTTKPWNRMISRFFVFKGHPKSASFFI